MTNETVGLSRFQLCVLALFISVTHTCNEIDFLMAKPICSICYITNDYHCVAGSCDTDFVLLVVTDQYFDSTLNGVFISST